MSLEIERLKNIMAKDFRENNLKELLWLAVKGFIVGGLGVALLLAFLARNYDLYNLLINVTFSGTMTVFLWIGNGLISEKLNDYISWVEEPGKRFVVSILTTLAYTVSISAIIAMIFFKVFLGRPFSETFSRLGGDILVTAILITFVIALFLHGRSFLLSWRDSVKETEALKRENLSSRYETLKNQVNPHFLFNSLNVLTSLVYKDQDLAVDFIKQMSKVYRYVLDTKEKEVVPIVTEKEALDAYIFLVKMRFGENLKTEIDIPLDNDVMIAPLTLQILVENAIKHNIISKAKPLTITVKKEEDHFIVHNNLQKKKAIESSSGIGLPNIQARYKFISGKEIIIDEQEDAFVVKVPVLHLK